MNAYAAIDKCGCVTAIVNNELAAKHLGPILMGMSRWAKEVRLITREQAVTSLCMAHTRKGCPHPNNCPTVAALTKEAQP